MFDCRMDLHRDGVAVVPLLSVAQTVFYRNAFRRLRYPEFISENGPYVMGAFGAHGHPSSFHNDVVRRLRSEIHPRMISFFKREFKSYKNKSNLYIEALFDRTCIRPEGSSIPKETWHRDLNPNTLIPYDEQHYMITPDQFLFGGWINLDDEPQHFSCCLSSHKEHIVAKTHKGFNIIGDLPDNYENTVIEIPSGHAIVFFQNILHQVLPKRQKKDSYRQFQVYRVIESTTEPLPLHPITSIQTWIKDQGTPLLASGQKPPMYSTNHSSVFLFKNTQNDPIQFSHKIHPNCLIQKVCQGGKHKGQTYTIVERHMRSLVEYNLPLYTPYSEEELQMFYPQRLYI